MRRLLSTIAVCLQVGLALPVSAEYLVVPHSYYTEYAPEQRTSIVPDLHEKIVTRINGFYQGQFELHSIVEHPRVSCSAVSSYPAEFFIEQHRRKVTINTPAGISLAGKIRKRNTRTGRKRFRATVVFEDGHFKRRVTIKGRLRSEFDARIVSTEKVFIEGTRVCKFEHRALMVRIGK